MTLGVMSHRSAAPKSILDGTSTSGAPAQPGAKGPAGADNLLDTLRKAQDRPAENAPAAPAPASPAPDSGTPAAPQSR
jgi:preprotein translocase subunit SecG